MTPQQQINRATADGFLLALTLMNTLGNKHEWADVAELLVGVANGTRPSRDSEGDELASLQQRIGRPLTPDPPARARRPATAA